MVRVDVHVNVTSPHEDNAVTFSTHAEGGAVPDTGPKVRHTAAVLNITHDAAAPEPALWAMLLAGLSALLFVSRRLRR